MSDPTLTEVMAGVQRLEALLAQAPRNPMRPHDRESAARYLRISLSTFDREVKRCPFLLQRAGVEDSAMRDRWLESQLDAYLLARGDESKFQTKGRKAA